MIVLKNYYKQIIKYDFLNKCNYKNINQIPKIKKIILNFNCKSFEIKKIATVLLALELISVRKSKITKANKTSLNIKVRKGYPIGCKAILEKKCIHVFLFTILNKIFPELKNFKGLTQQKNKKSFSFSIKDLINFTELNSNFYLFTNLPPLNITIIFDTRNNTELNFFTKSLKIPLLKS